MCNYIYNLLQNGVHFEPINVYKLHSLSKKVCNIKCFSILQLWKYDWLK